MYPAELKVLDENAGDWKLQVGVNTQGWRFKKKTSAPL